MLVINVDRFFVSLFAKWNAFSVPLWAASAMGCLCMERRELGQSTLASSTESVESSLY
jgi:hypothetical protein